VERFLIGDASEIVVGAGLLRSDPVVVPRPDRRLTVILTQPAAAGWAGKIERSVAGSGIRAEVVTLPDGEAAKSLAVVEEVYRQLNDLGTRRGDTIVGAGGGTVTDLAGFVASTYLRGMECVYVPTTLLGAVDASIGGKTGVNLDGKNLVGTFAHPARVVVDTDILRGLGEDLWREGASEALKAGLIGDPVLVDLFERHGRAVPIDDLVTRAIAVKVGVVTEDFREAGRRAVLNYGHTVGHAIEVGCRISHGSAVSIGMVAAGRAAALVTGFTDEERQRHLIASLGLPLAAPAIDRDEVLRLIEFDKKRDQDGSRMVLLHRIGDPVVVAVDHEVIGAALEAIGV